MKKFWRNLFIIFTVVSVSGSSYAQLSSEGAPLPSLQPDEGVVITQDMLNSGPVTEYKSIMNKTNLLPANKVFEGFSFRDNPAENFGFLFIPPDPIGAAGNSQVIAVVNSMIEARAKGGRLQWREGLYDFFSPLSPANLPFDPKIIYDEHYNRFLVVALEQITGTGSVSPDNVSRILMAVSKTTSPDNATADQWFFHAIDAKTVIPRPTTPYEHWADYPGMEVDENFIYITANMFTFVPFGSYGGVRLWIVPKVGFYYGLPAVSNIYNPYAEEGIATTTMPAYVHGVTGAGLGIGTYLVSYSGLSDGVDEFIQVVRVNTPLNPTFVQEFVNIGDIETGFPALPDAPQLGSPYLIEVNDRRALDAEWRDNGLWLTTTVRPNSGTDINQTTAMWVKLNTSGVANAASDAGLITLDDYGYIGGEDIAAGTYTYFPSVVVNKDNNAMFGFSASAASIYAGAYAAGRINNYPAGTVSASYVIKAGEAPYKRFFSGPRNRWGDYSGISLEPNNKDYVWVFNEFADTPGIPTNGSQGVEDGVWGTAWGRVSFSAIAKNGAEVLAENMIYKLDQNYPNPFNPSTIIKYETAEKGNVLLKIYDPLGREVAALVNEIKEPGRYEAVFNAKGLSSGLYLYKLQTNGYTVTKKMMFVK